MTSPFPTQSTPSSSATPLTMSYSGSISTENFYNPRQLSASSVHSRHFGATPSPSPSIHSATTSGFSSHSNSLSIQSESPNPRSISPSRPTDSGYKGDGYIFSSYSPSSTLRFFYRYLTSYAQESVLRLPQSSSNTAKYNVPPYAPNPQYISSEGLVSVPGVGYVTPEFYQTLPHAGVHSLPLDTSGERPQKRLRLDQSVVLQSLAISPSSCYPPLI